MNGLSKSLSYFERVVAPGETRAPATLVDWGLELRLWVATCVTGLSLFSARALSLVLDASAASALAIVFFATLALYNLDGSLDAPGRAAPADLLAARRRKHLHLGLTGISAVALLFLVARLSPQALLLTGGGALACSLYAIPLTLGKKQTHPTDGTVRLKSLPFLKAPFVGCAVGTAAVWVPIWAQEGSFSQREALALSCTLSLYCTANALLFDIPDVGEDGKSGIPTLPVRWGLAGTRWASRGLILAGLLFSGLFASHGASLSGAVALLSLGATLLAFTEFLDYRTPRRSVALWVDGALLLPLSFQFFLAF